MWDGKKELARGIVYGALDILSKKCPKESAVSVFKKAIDNCKPNLEVRSRRVGRGHLSGASGCASCP